ncbi:PAS domain S-box-containing protein/diguanylate cyclase (GGDEF) domain-containing protein [Formivibrio citricus]|uniref:PAS domain S-box-containing protein/diguanylate cyclase (GGDEF) domain-containing protein n=1 Tax=Formivibrio citricus TaxID=83765 RepID=A0A1I4XDC8_9NEIS|nr:sensor domain-containing diguanylate cyclase [Formivibrio citricus]SFN23300.1 PAS domain S-box-containing protein/diguanylate cyclase (GGDEF) domain-containing protein [Formivibrio citricus]
MRLASPAPLGQFSAFLARLAALVVLAFCLQGVYAAEAQPPAQDKSLNREVATDKATPPASGKSSAVKNVARAESEFDMDKASASSRDKYRDVLFASQLAVIVLTALCWLFFAINRRLKTEIQAKEALSEELRKAGQEYEALLDSAPFPVVVTSLQDGRIEYVNTRAAELYGAPKENLIGHPAADSYTNPRQREEVIGHVKRDGKLIDFEAELENLYGERRQVLLSCIQTTMRNKPVILTAFSDITSLKQAKQEIINREWQLRSVIENAPIPIVICQIETHLFHYINQRAATILGLTQDEATGRSFADYFVNLADLELLESRRGAHDGIRDIEARLINEPGIPFWALISSQIGEMDGKKLAFYSFSDISLQKKAEESITQSEQELRRLLDFAPTPILIIHLTDNRVLYANRLAGEQTGIDAEHPENETVANYCETGELERLSGLLQKDGFVSGFETRIYPRRGAPFWVLMTVGRTRFQLQQALIVAFSNIDERKRMEEILRESEERLRFIADNTADVIWQMDRDFNILYINESDEKLRGFPREQVVGQPASTLFTPEYAEYYVALGNERMRQENEGIITGTYTYQAQQIRADGTSIWVEVVSTPQRNEQGEIVFFTGVTRDISERKKAEQTLKATNAKLSEQLQQIRELQAALQEQAIRDPLTGLFNRRYFDEAVEMELARAQREGYPVTFALLDLDHFKQINDTYGHQAGDEALKNMARILRESSRGSDIACRFGGEEFLLLLPNLGLEAAHNRAEAWRQRLANTEIHFGQFSFFITASIGLAAYPQHGRRADDLVRQADEALYRAKSSGRNQVIIAAYPPESPSAR